MKPILDATAGNRHLWGKNKYPENVVFMDKEKNLRIPPDVIATWDKIPYPDDYFHCIIFDLNRDGIPDETLFERAVAQ